MRDLALEVRGPFAPADGTTQHAFEWRVRQIGSDQILASGIADSEQDAIEECRAHARSVMSRRTPSETETTTWDAAAPTAAATETAAPETRAATAPTTKTAPTQKTPPAAATQTAPTPKTAPAATTQTAPTPKTTPATTATDTGTRDAATANRRPATQPAATAATTDPTMTAVLALSRVSDQLPDLAQVATDLLAKAMVEGEAEAAAALFDDDQGAWRVVASSGLRPLEQRSGLAPTHWLVRRICAEGQGILVQDTDLIRQQLVGAPLASWPHLLAIPLADGRGLLLLARNGKRPFNERNLRNVTAVARSGSGLLGESLDVRRLARAMERYAEDLAPL